MSALAVMGMMDETRRRRVADIAGEDDRKRTVAGELLARQMLAARLGCPEKDVPLSWDELGKPSVEREGVRRAHELRDALRLVGVRDVAERDCERLFDVVKYIMLRPPRQLRQKVVRLCCRRVRQQHHEFVAALAADLRLLAKKGLQPMRERLELFLFETFAARAKIPAMRQ